MIDSPDDSTVLVDGPWSHRMVRANGIALHVAEIGSGPLVLLLHGFPQFWWTWRHQLVDLADAGFRAAAVDLRGYGASDKPPRGYDIPTMSTDIAKLVTAMGEDDAVIVGHDIGGLLGWTVAATHPAVVRRLAVLGTAHPLPLRHAVVTDLRGQGRASRYVVAGFQVPRRPEARLARPEYVRQLFDRWSGPAWPGRRSYAEDVDRYAQAMRIHPVAHLALEQFRWLVRSFPRPDGRRWVKAMHQPVAAPVLQLHGELDTCVLPSTAQGSGRYVADEYEWRLLDGVGHFLSDEAPGLISGELVRWAKQG